MAGKKARKGKKKDSGNGAAPAAVAKRSPGRPRVNPMDRKVGTSISLSFKTWARLNELAEEREQRLSEYVEVVIEEHFATMR